MVGGNDTLDGNVLPAHVRFQLGDIVAEARQLDDETAAAPLHDEHLVGQRIVRLVGMEPRRAQVVHAHGALAELDGLEVVLLHDLFLSPDELYSSFF